MKTIAYTPPFPETPAVATATRRGSRVSAGVKTSACRWLLVGALALGCAGSARAQDVTVTVTTLVNFDRANGALPYAAVTLGPDGNLYGTTDGRSADKTTDGTIFKLTPGGALTTLFRFPTDPNNNAAPYGGEPSGLVQGNDGNFYGTTKFGGAQTGTVFSITASGTLTTIHSFTGGYGLGVSPEAALIQGRDGNFYGTTHEGFDNYGSVFTVSPSGAYAQLALFAQTADGEGLYGRNPAAALLQGSDGNFYGTTPIGGPGTSGTVFKYTPGSGLSLLASFSGPNGATPGSELIQGSDGNFYGTTYYGGSQPNPNFAGTVFRLTPAGALTTLVNFDGSNGSSPVGALIQGHDGNFYGTTYSGSGNVGTIFRMTPSGVLTTLYRFPTDGSMGGGPSAALIQDPNGDFYGTGILGGSGGYGTVFRLTVTPGVPALDFPTVSVAAAGGERGGFLLTRPPGSAGAPLTVFYHVGSSAIGGSDYETLPGSASFEAGQSEAVIAVTLLPEANRNHKIKLFLDPAPAGDYALGKAKAKLLLSDLP